ncbi:protein of unknown function [Ruminococcaceae bacterium BL-4]|nr:protein of unknown function [Ruminococcaceae bacterium BL-4]
MIYNANYVTLIYFGFKVRKKREKRRIFKRCKREKSFHRAWDSC